MTEALIKQYVDLLKAYNEHTNIYSKGAYDRLPFHLEDCMNMADIIGDSPLEVLDIGSGAGLPAVIIAMLNPNNQVTAVESKSRKTRFLEEAKAELGLDNFRVVNKDINLYLKEKPEPDVITAKAYAPYDRLIKQIQPLYKHHPQLLVPISRHQKEALQGTLAEEDFISEDPYFYIYKPLD